MMSLSPRLGSRAWDECPDVGRQARAGKDRLDLGQDITFGPEGGAEASTAGSGVVGARNAQLTERTVAEEVAMRLYPSRGRGWRHMEW